MAANHYEIDQGTQAGNTEYAVFRNLANAWDSFLRLRGILIESKDTGAAGNLQYAAIAARGFYSGADVTAKQAVAAASFAEIDSCFGAANNAITQVLNRHL